MQRDRQLDDAQARGEMTAELADHINHPVPDLAGDLWQFVLRESPQIFGRIDTIKKRHGFLLHGCSTSASATPYAVPVRTSVGVCPRSSIKRSPSMEWCSRKSSSIRFSTRACLPAARRIPAASYITMRQKNAVTPKSGEDQPVPSP